MNGKGFADRAEAGRRLAARIGPAPGERPAVYALPRGGVPVGLEIARALGAPLDIVLVRKLPAPGQPELALGAVVDGAAPHMVVNARVRAHFGLDDAEIAALREAALAEIARRRALYLAGRAPVDPRGRTAILADDGLATGASMKAAIRAMRAAGAGRILVALPVAPREALAELEGLADAVVCLVEAEAFPGVGAFYRDFHQLSDDETVALLRAAPGDRSPARPGPSGQDGE